MQPAAPVRILLVDDDEDDFVITRDLLRECNPGRFELDWASSYDGALEQAAKNRHDLYLVDYRLGARHGLDLLREVSARGVSAPVIMLTGQGNHELDVQAMNAGAADFLVKGELTSSLLERAIRYALDRAHALVVLRSSEERYRVLFDENPQLMWVYDPRSLRILAVNSASIQHYGYSREEFWALDILALHAAEDRPAARCAARGAAAGFQRTGGWRHLKKDGTRIQVELTPYDLRFDGRPARLVLARDVTERLNLEAQLRQSQKMESVGQLAAGVAHDFSNILTVIHGQATLALADRSLAPNIIESLGQIRTAADRAVRLTRQLLAFSRCQVMELRRLDLNEVIRNIAQMLRRLLGEAIELDFDLAPDLPLLQADRGMLEQVIVNLAVNSRDAMPNGGKLSLATSGVDVDPRYTVKHPEAMPGPCVCLRVMDTGVGMDPQTMGRIFEPFFTTKPSGKGTGLGLSTVYGILKQHQGWADVRSQPGQGTVFEIFLPVKSECLADDSDPVASGEIRGGTERILVVEDESDLRCVLQTLLEVHGYEVVTAANGAEALERWQERGGGFALLLTDIVMPNGLSGTDLGLKLQKEDPHLRIIYTSGYSLDLVGRALPLVDGQNYLQKPFPQDRLIQTVRRCLDRPAAGS
jgi:two-component system, cell cycle sensor histidine kinase and response regulator CckA